MNNQTDNKREFLRCGVCGNIVGMIENAGPPLSCCGEEMILLTASATDASKEKHVPVIKISKNMLNVDVGTQPHPMTGEHHISWIAVAQGGLTQRITLDKTGAPAAAFSVTDGPVTVYAYCNIHGLWTAEGPQKN